MNERVIENGTELSFLNGGADPIYGIVNGTPMIGWDDEARAVVTYIPVWAPSLSECLYVNAANVVKFERVYSVKA